jgi:twitching motility protein PilT
MKAEAEKRRHALVEKIAETDDALLEKYLAGEEIDVHALKAALREDINVVLVGEMRDLESISATLTLAETGHLIFATMHTNDAAQSVDRIVDVFPGDQQAQIRAQLANTLLGVASLRLLPKVGGGRIPATEIMVVNHAIRNVIRDNKIYEISNVIHTSMEEGMIPLDKVLAQLVQQGLVEREIAESYVLDNDYFMSLLG